MSNNPLAGVRVVEIGRFVTGPLCAQLLADLGADVVKVEDPNGGDPFRMWNRGAAGGYGPPFGPNTCNVSMCFGLPVCTTNCSTSAPRSNSGAWARGSSA